MPKRPKSAEAMRYLAQLKVSRATQRDIRRRAARAGYHYWTAFAPQAVLEQARMRAKQLGVSLGAVFTAVTETGMRHVTTSQIIAAQARWYADVWNRKPAAPQWPGHPFAAPRRGPKGKFVKTPGGRFDTASTDATG